jgi:predicted nucleotidyltransferase
VTVSARLQSENAQEAFMARLDIPQIDIEKFCVRNQIKRLALFGSILRDDFRPDSDIDILVEFMPGRHIGMLAMARMERELAQLFAGRKIDLRTPFELSRYFRDEVLKNAEICYDS